MRLDPYMADNFATAFLWTNNPTCIKLLGALIRRVTAVETSGAKIGDTEYFNKLLAILKDPEGLQSIFDFLVNRDISDFNCENTPVTSFMTQMKEDSLSDVHRYISDVCNNERSFTMESKLLTVPKDEMYQDYRSYCQTNGIQSKFVMIAKNFVSELGRMNIPCQRVRVDESRQYCFILSADDIEKDMRKILKNPTWVLIKDLE